MCVWWCVYVWWWVWGEVLEEECKMERGRKYVPSCLLPVSRKQHFFTNSFPEIAIPSHKNICKTLHFALLQRKQNQLPGGSSHQRSEFQLHGASSPSSQILLHLTSSLCFFSHRDGELLPIVVSSCSFFDFSIT